MPSKVLAEGDVFDLYVYETVLSYERYLEDKEKMERGEVTSGNTPMLQAMMEKVKGFGNAS